MELRQIRYFIAVAQGGSVSGAASDLGIAQPAISRQIRLLEQQLGAPLFLRNAHGMVLTDAGRTLLRLSEDLKSCVDRIEEEFEVNKTKALPRLEVGLPPAIGKLVFSGAYASMNEFQRKVNLRIIEGSSHRLEEWVNTGEVDLAISTNPAETHGPDRFQLWEEPLFLVGSPQAISSMEPGIKSLNEIPLALPPRQDGVRKYLMQQFVLENIKPNVTMELESLASLLECIASGRVFGMLPLSAFYVEMNSLRLSATNLSGFSISRVIIFSERFGQKRESRLFSDVLYRNVKPKYMSAISNFEAKMFKGD